MGINVTKTIKLSTVMILTMGLIACGGNDGQLGYNKSVPDEFNVVRRAPLIIPPEFHLLPPSSQNARPAAPQGAELARLIVLPNAPQPLSSKTERNLIEKAGGGKAYGYGVREALDNQARGTVSESAAIIDALVADQSGDN